MPLRLSIMYLVSQGKVSILDENLVKFVNKFVVESKWDNEVQAEYGAFLVD